ncbi:vWA domain-containing protein [Caldimonas tepidiphila]|uniref:vWA domain-containing protein n=1 Tax=Caldimonas tepidiphila TaxID=2315841 RepID=UPI001300B562|nr:VWA domain-containing protein [Caldimonas tepidiphila]
MHSSKDAAPGPVDAPWHHLEPLPRELWLPALVASAGRTPRRLAELARWRDALLAGELPEPGADFGDAEALDPMRAAIGELGLPALCRGTPALALQVLRTLLWHLDRIVDHQPRLGRAEAAAQAAQDFRAEWQQERAGVEEALALLQGLGELGELRWDELRGRLGSREWRETQRIGALLAQLPALAALIERLGREQRRPQALPARQPDPSARPAHEPAELQPRVVPLPDAPGEVRGVRRSGQLSRMLAGEAAQLRHPVLKKLWRARFVEQRLLTFEDAALLHEWQPAPSPPRQRAARAEAPLAHGPIIVCVDTSGSMRGAPENLAKAVVLQALRTAHAQGRACLLIAFGGPGELIEHRLGAGRAGLDALLAFMGQAFDGGTDVQTPLERAIERVHESQWRSADLLIASDGEFGVTPATLERLDAARERFGLRVQGVLIGDRETLGLLEVCDHVHWVRDWRRWATDAREAYADGFTPVHSRSLTALYFPNALSERARRRAGG